MRSDPARESLLTFRETECPRGLTPPQRRGPPSIPAASSSRERPNLHSPQQSQVAHCSRRRGEAEISPYRHPLQLLPGPQRRRKREGDSGSVLGRRCPAQAGPGPSPFGRPAPGPPRHPQPRARSVPRVLYPAAALLHPVRAPLAFPGRCAGRGLCTAGSHPQPRGTPANSSPSRLSPLPAGAAAPLSAPPPPSCISKRLHFSGSQL